MAGAMRHGHPAATPGIVATASASFTTNTVDDRLRKVRAPASP